MKRQRAKERRLAKKQQKAYMDPTVYAEACERTLERLEKAFRELRLENDPGHLDVNRNQLRLEIFVKGVGDYVVEANLES